MGAIDASFSSFASKTTPISTEIPKIYRNQQVSTRFNRFLLVKSPINFEINNNIFNIFLFVKKIDAYEIKKPILENIEEENGIYTPEYLEFPIGTFALCPLPIAVTYTSIKIILKFLI